MHVLLQEVLAQDHAGLELEIDPQGVILDLAVAAEVDADHVELGQGHARGGRLGGREIGGTQPGRLGRVLPLFPGPCECGDQTQERGGG
jgi:hypothetical protein